MTNRFDNLSNHILLKFFKNYPELTFILKFFFLFSFLYYGTTIWIGISSPGNLYFPFINHYLNYPLWLRSSIINASRLLMEKLGYDVVISANYQLKLRNGLAVNLAYVCVGYGILSFWIAFIISTKEQIKKKLSWLLLGLTLIWVLNVLRVIVLLILVNERLDYNKFGDHHTFFNSIVYIIILVMIFFFVKKKRIKQQ